MAVVLPGKALSTRKEKSLVRSRGKELMFHEGDLKHLYREGIPIVIVSNGDGYFCSTTRIDERDLVQSKVENFIDLVNVSCTLGEEILPNLTDDACQLVTRFLSTGKTILDTFSTGDVLSTRESFEELTGLSANKSVFLQSVPGPAPESVQVAPGSEQSEKNRKYKCDTCGDQFHRKPRLMDHIRKEHQGYLFTCEYCGKDTFKNSDSLAEHIRHLHGPGYRFPCTQPKCSWQGPTEDRRDSHLREKHGIGNDIECPHCGSKVKCRSTLQRHLKDSCKKYKAVQASQRSQASDSSVTTQDVQPASEESK